MRRTLTVLIIALLAAAGGGCRGSRPPQIAPELATSDEALFKEAEKYLKKDPERARLYLRQIIDSFPRSFYAQRAQLAIADTYFAAGDEGNMILAATEYRQFISLYPYSPSAAYAQYQVAMSFFTKILKPGRDQQKTIQALNEFKRVTTTYPQTEEAEKAREKIQACEERLAEHNYIIGYHYYRVKAFRAATVRLTEVLTNYPFYSGLDKLYFTLGDAFFQWGKVDEAGPFFTKLITDFPKSSHAKKAVKRLKEIEALKAKAAPPAKEPAKKA
ncbi:MAG: outer membrane protein assembly factor BamD [Candidatus Aminicenantes bacterium]|nr:outer membrane protein assembly factor BamD [Candidatus Aminicenantes bacterium]